MSSLPARSERAGISAPRELALDAAWLAAVKACVSAVVLAAGFSALSDDDFARVTIAQRFVEAPSLDPSGTSWLPFPFWIYGASLGLFGASLEVARATAFAAGIVSALLVGAAARVLGLGRTATWIGAGLAAVFPYSALLGVATVPEALAASLSVFGAATLSRGANLRLAGAGCLFLAAASRYETWAVAGVFAAFTAFDAITKRDVRLCASALLAVTFPLLWALHGLVRHGDATFFVSRVTAYRAALGETSQGIAEMLRTPRALAMTELELVCLVAALLALLWVAGRWRELERFRRLAVALAAIPLFLAAGDVRGSAPTHHGERALLAVWLGMAIVAGFAGERCFAPPRKRALTLSAAALLAAALLGFALRPSRAPEAFGAREAEVDIGRLARARGVARLAIDAPDFGFFAVQAAFGTPSQTFVLDDRDPRRPRPSDRLATDAQALHRELLARRIDAIAVPRHRAAFVRAFGAERASNSDWVLIELGSEQGRRGSPRSVRGEGGRNDRPQNAGPSGARARD